MTLLALDIGNGSIKFASFGPDGEPRNPGRLALDADLGRLPVSDQTAAVSVNPPVLERIRAARPGLCVVGEDLALPIAVRYDPPEACGRDRVMSVVGALDHRPEAPAVLVLDAGTCLTATLAIRDQGIVGGAILPGVDLMLRSLSTWTAALPEVEARPPERWVGTSTAESMRSGVWAAWIGAARELLKRSRDECGRDLETVATGTGAEALAAEVTEIDGILPHATLRGVHRTATRG